MFRLANGGYVIDSPGLKVLGLWQMKREDLDNHYPEMSDLRSGCRFTHCSHISEPDCRIKKAVETGEIAAWRYQNYCQIYESL